MSTDNRNSDIESVKIQFFSKNFSLKVMKEESDSGIVLEQTQITFLPMCPQKMINHQKEEILNLVGRSKQSTPIVPIYINYEAFFSLKWDC